MLSRGTRPHSSNVLACVRGVQSAAGDCEGAAAGAGGHCTRGTRACWRGTPSSSRPPSAWGGRDIKPGINVYRFANRIPLLFEVCLHRGGVGASCLVDGTESWCMPLFAGGLTIGGAVCG